MKIYPLICLLKSAVKSQKEKHEGEDVVSFGIGDPDIPTPPHIIERLCKEAHVPANHRYPESEGLPELRKTIADWYLRSVLAYRLTRKKK